MLIPSTELRLLAPFGPEYLHTDPAVVLPQAEGDSLVMRSHPVVRSMLAEARDRWQPGLGVLAVHPALRGNPGFPSPTGPVDGMVAQIGAPARGGADSRDPWLLVVNRWDDAEEGYARELSAPVRARTSGLDAADHVAVRAESPVDVAGHDPHDLGGSCHGGEFVLAAGSVVPGWPSHRTSVPGLLLTGATAHPGGSVSGRPGRDAARTVLTASGLEPARVMGPS